MTFSNNNAPSPTTAFRTSLIYRLLNMLNVCTSKAIHSFTHSDHSTNYYYCWSALETRYALAADVSPSNVRPSVL